jgi:hypothetical protein
MRSLFASDKMLKNFAALLQDKSMANYEAVARAIREDLYLERTATLWMTSTAKPLMRLAASQ